MITQMKIPRFIIAILVGAILLIGPTLGTAEKAADFKTLLKEAQEAEGQERGLDQRICLDLRGLDVADALKYLSVRGGINIVVSKNVAGRITFMLTDVPIRDVFDVILRSNNLAYEKRGEVYTVMTEKEYKARYGKEFSDVRQVQHISG